MPVLKNGSMSAQCTKCVCVCVPAESRPFPQKNHVPDLCMCFLSASVTNSGCVCVLQGSLQCGEALH